MAGRNLWIGACVLGAGLIFWGVGQAVGPSSGDTEFQKTLDAMMKVKSFRGTFIESASGSLHSQRLWEVDCNKVIFHQQSQGSQSNADSSFEMKDEEASVGTQRYTRDRNGSWEKAEAMLGDRYSAEWYCENIAKGIASDLLPDIRTMLQHAVSEKGGKKEVNGVRCREWKFDIRTAISSKVGSVCIGVDDHLPYELNVDGGTYSYSDYNRPIQFEGPEAVVQPASSAAGSN